VKTSARLSSGRSLSDIKRISLFLKSANVLSGNPKSLLFDFKSPQRWLANDRICMLTEEGSSDKLEPSGMPVKLCSNYDHIESVG
jgi:hypothetical protein